jgi:predicted DNA-binding transcriptional regulator AlpA
MKSNSENIRQSLKKGQITEGDQVSRRIHKLLSEREVEALFGFRARTLQRWRFLGVGPVYVKASKCVYYRESDIEEFIAARLRTSTRRA